MKINKKEIRFGFIGAGSISCFHAQAVLALGHKIDCVCTKSNSVNSKKFVEKFDVKSYFLDWQEMIRERSVDALVVAVSWNQTEKIISDIIKAGIPCLIEKPLALTSKVHQRISENVSGFTDKVMVGYNRRFYNGVEEVRRALQSKTLLSIELSCPEPLKRVSDRNGDAIKEHILAYMSAHWLDIMVYLFGEVRVKDMYKTILGKEILAYNGVLMARGSIPIHFQCNFNAPSNTRITFNFQNSVYQLSPVEHLQVIDSIDIIEPNSENPIRRYVPKVSYSIDANAEYKPGFLEQMTNFVNHCVYQESKRIGCSLEESLLVAQLCCQIKKDAKEICV